jgi:hypothetical protein
VAPLTSMYIMVTQVGNFINVLLVDVVNKISNQIMDDRLRTRDLSPPRFAAIGPSIE